MWVFFWARVSKNYCHIFNQYPQTLLIAVFDEKTKMPQFITKNPLFGYFWASF